MTITQRQLKDGGIPALIFDVLETWFGEWHTIQWVTHRVQLVRPAVHASTVNRLVWRLVEDGHIQCNPGKDRARFQVEERAYLKERISA